MGRRSSAEIPGEDNGAILGNDQLGSVYANVKLVADNIEAIITVSEGLGNLDELSTVVTTINSAIAEVDADRVAAQTAATAAAASAGTATTDAAAALASKNAAQTSETNADASADAAAASATAAAGSATAAGNSATAAATSAATATTQAGLADADRVAAETAAATATTKASEAATSATTATTKAAEALASANDADADRTAAQNAKTLAETALSLSIAARDAALAAQAAAEAARDEAEGIAGGDIVTGSEFDAGMALKADKAGATFTGKVNAMAPTATEAGLNVGYGVSPGSNALNGDIWATDTGIFVRYNGGNQQLSPVGHTHSYLPLTGGSVGNISINTATEGAITFSATGLAKLYGNATYMGFWKTGGMNVRFDLTTGTLSTDGGGTFGLPVTIPAEAYGSTWNGKQEAATKDALYDEIEALKGLVVGAMVYKGVWNATTNSPAIPAASAANKGWFYKVSTVGSTNVSGITDWAIGDWIVSNGTSWDKIDNTENVSSVNGQTGPVVLDKGDIGLSNVDNTSDANKPVSTAQQTALDLKFNASGGTVGGNLNVTGDITATGDISASSDRRLKTEIRPIGDCLSLVQAMQGVRYQMLATPGQDKIGVIAQDMEAVLPEVVMTDSEGMKSVDYSKLTAVLIEAVKTLTERVQELEGKI